MRKLATLSIIFYYSFYSLTCLAGKNILFTIPGLIYSGPADEISFGVPIGKNWGSTITEQAICNTRASNIARANIIALSNPSDLNTVIDGVSYPVYETGTNGVGWVMGVKDTNATNFSAVKVDTNQWYPAPGTSNNQQSIIGGTLKITFVKTAEHLNSGQTSLYGTDIAKISCFDSAGREVDSGIISINAVSMTVIALGCTVMGSSSSTVSLGEFSASQFKTVNSTQGNAVSNTSVSCDKNINVNVTISDQTDDSNRSNILKLTSDSTANGVGIQALYQGNLISFGPDDSSKGNQNQFALVTTTSNNEVVHLDLNFRYIRTGEIKAGSANGLVGITFSYQ